MQLPIPHPTNQIRPLTEFLERHDTLRMVMEWIADRFADDAEGDTSIDWEDGEDHDDDSPTPLPEA